LRENHNFQGHKVFLGKIRTLNSGWYTFFATHCISHLNTEVDWIFLAVDVTLWVVYICALVSNPWLATDRFLKTGHSGPHFADKPVVDSRNATAALFFLEIRPTSTISPKLSQIVITWVVRPRLLAQYKRQNSYIGLFMQSQKSNNNKQTRLTALFPDYPGEPVPER